MIRRRVMMMTTETAASGGVGLGRGGRLSRQRKRDAVLRRPVCCVLHGAHHHSGNLLGPHGKAGGNADVGPSRVKEALRAVCAVKAVARHSTVLLQRPPFRAAPFVLYLF